MEFMQFFSMNRDMQKRVVEAVLCIAQFKRILQKVAKLAISRAFEFKL